MSYNKFAYIAAPWFNPRQLEILEEVKSCLDQVPLTYYSPKDEVLYVPGGDVNPKEVLDTNVEAMDDANILVVITDGKDTGTMFEAGYAHAMGMPIFYVWIDHKPGDKFNLMLGASGKVCMNYEELISELTEFIIEGDSLVKHREDITYE
jgi:nucleoside 2-deoxyribosyltransferase